MTDVILLPGIGNSGAEHWQTKWQDSHPTFHRFQPASWDEPCLKDWLQALEQAIAQQHTAPVLVVHSLACLLVAQWAAQDHLPIAGAFLVAPPDPTSDAFPPEAQAFACSKITVFDFPTLVVASENDPYGSLSYAKAFAQASGADFTCAGALGHINDVDNWPQGWELFHQFLAKTGLSPTFIS